MSNCSLSIGELMLKVQGEVNVESAILTQDVILIGKLRKTLTKFCIYR